jgi:hypothetical protein
MFEDAHLIHAYTRAQAIAEHDCGIGKARPA